MLSDSANFHEIQTDHKALQIKQDNKFFNKIMSKETSMANSPSTVYYGGALAAIPFDWESHPGTPKHHSSVTRFRPLTPPPSYHSLLNSKPKPKPVTKKGQNPSTFLGSIFRKLMAPRRKFHASSLSSSPSLSSLSSWSPLHDFGSSSSSFLKRKIFHRRRNYISCSCSCSRSPVHNCMDDDNDDVDRLGSSATTLCFRFKVKPKNQPMVKMKKALL